jgi:23S rRNA (pseudouridine1915-N3)-methyltransferase
MRLHVSAIGRLRQGPELGLAQAYLDEASALGRRAGFTAITVHELAESRARAASLRRKEESARLVAALPVGSLLIVLDERGRQLSSRALADELARLRDSGLADLAFLIGGPDGHDPDLTARARLALSLGLMTWPHRLVRIMLAEQIYRSVTILINHPYHRA